MDEKKYQLVAIFMLLSLSFIIAKSNESSNLAQNSFKLSTVTPPNNKPLYVGSRLTWTSAISGNYDVYIGEVEESVVNADVKSKLFKGRVRTNFFDIIKLNLKPGTKYYWRVDVHNLGKTYKSDVNAFIYPLKSNKYHVLRVGLRNSLIQFERNKTGRVAFLGGSITENGGWRDSVCKYLKKRFPQTRFDFIPAGIGSTGSTPGAFRMERHVLSKGKVDLLFEDAAVNDGTNGNRFPKVEQIRGMEGIVRHALISNPDMDIVLLYCVDPGKIASYNKNESPEVIANHDLVAQTYFLPSVNLAREVTNRINIGEFNWKNDFVNLHPSPFGQGVYARSIISLLESAWKKPLAKSEKLNAKILPAKIDEYSYDSGYLVDIEKAELSTGWSIVPNWSPTDSVSTRNDYVNVPMLISNAPDAVLTFKFKGKAVGISTSCGPDAGIISSSIDDGLWKTTDLFTSWSKSVHLPWYYTLYSELTEGEHILKIKISTDKNPKSVGNYARIRYFFVNGTR